MEQQKRKIPVFRVVAYAIMIVGILLFFLTPLFLKYLDLDTDVLGLLVVLVGLAVLILGSVVRLVVRTIRKGRQS